MPAYRTRAELGLRTSGSGLRKLAVPVDTLFIHHTVTAGGAGPAEWRNVQRFHMDTRGYQDIAYHGGIGPDATVMEGRPPTMEGGATLKWNNRSLAICFVGTYSEHGASDAQLDAAAWLAQLWMLYGLLAPDCSVLGHLDAGTTACPGRGLYAQLPELRRRVFAPIPRPAPVPEDDMPARPILLIVDRRTSEDFHEAERYRAGAVYARFATGAVEHIGGAEYGYYRSLPDDQGGPVPERDADPANNHAEADRLARRA